MDIAAISTVMSQNQVKQQAGIMVAKKVMDSTKISNDNLLKMLDASKIENIVKPHLGGNIDVKI